MPARNEFQKMRNFAVYYGRDAVNALAQFDVVIIEPSAHTEDELRHLTSRGTLVLAYVSVVEVRPDHALFKEVRERDFLYQNGRPMVNAQYGTWMADLTSPAWRGALLRHIGELLVNRGYDGVFLDTIGNVESPSLPEQALQFEAAVRLVREIRQWFPDRILIQNNGLEKLCMNTAPYLNGIMWENPPLDLPDSATWVNAVTQRMRQLAQDHSMKLLMLFSGAEHMSRKNWIVRRRFADANGFVVYFSNDRYLGEVRPPLDKERHE